MSFPVVREDFPKICRLCLNHGDLSSIFSEDTSNVLTEITNLQVKQNDSLPQNICTVCKRQLEVTFSFIKVCRNNDKLLRAVIQEDLKYSNENTYKGDPGIKTELDEINVLKESNCDNQGESTAEKIHDPQISTLYDDSIKSDSDNEQSNQSFPTENTKLGSDVNDTAYKSEIVRSTSDLVIGQAKSRKFLCKYCGKVYVRKKRFQTHLKAHRAELEKTTTSLKSKRKNNSQDVKEEIISEPDIADSPVNCENCNADFSCLNELVEHYKEIPTCRPRNYNSPSSEINHIIKFMKRNKTKKEKVKLEDSYEEPEYIKGRKLKGTRRFLCNYCGKNYTRKNGLERHILSHTGVKPFECRECGKRYSTKDTLKTHILTHTGVKAHKCETCQKSFTQSSHLSYHMKRHAGEKPYICSFCGKAFLSNYHLERHKLMHTGVKPFVCHLCGKHFVRSTTLRDHLLIHSGEKPFQCQHCGKQFNRKQSLTNHMLVHNDPQKSNGTNYGNSLLYSEINIPDVATIHSSLQEMSSF